jgi:cation transport regulator ChaC
LSVGFVFGYGSLVEMPDKRSGERAAGGRSSRARLHGWRRGWGVAMDNAETIPGYKYYVAPDGERPDVCVAFLDMRPERDAWVNGVCVPVGLAELEQLDRRERNYHRIDVTAAIEPAIGPTWSYAGRVDSRARYADAAATGRAVVASEYLERVERGFLELGVDAWDEFVRSTAAERPPLRRLCRVDVR